MPWKECSLLPKYHGLSPNDSVKAKWILFTDAHSNGGVHSLFQTTSGTFVLLDDQQVFCIVWPSSSLSTAKLIVWDKYVVVFNLRLSWQKIGYNSDLC